MVLVSSPRFHGYITKRAEKKLYLQAVGAKWFGGLTYNNWL